MKHKNKKKEEEKKKEKEEEEEKKKKKKKRRKKKKKKRRKKKKKKKKCGMKYQLQYQADLCIYFFLRACNPYSLGPTNVTGRREISVSSHRQ